MLITWQLTDPFAFSDRDPESFNMNGEEIERRRRLYAVLYCRDKYIPYLLLAHPDRRFRLIQKLQAMKWGLPSMLASADSDVKLFKSDGSFEDTCTSLMEM
jgi:hypothetical protein